MPLSVLFSSHCCYHTIEREGQGIREGRATAAGGEVPPSGLPPSRQKARTTKKASIVARNVSFLAFKNVSKGRDF